MRLFIVYEYSFPLTNYRKALDVPCAPCPPQMMILLGFLFKRSTFRYPPTNTALNVLATVKIPSLISIAILKRTFLAFIKSPTEYTFEANTTYLCKEPF